MTNPVVAKELFSKKKALGSLFRLVMLLMLTVIILPGKSKGGSFTDMLREGQALPWEIKADSVEYDSKNDIYRASDGVTITKGKKKLTADFVRFSRKTMDALARGHVVMSTGEDTLTGDMIEINLMDETGVIYNGNILTHEQHFYIKGEKIEKVGKLKYIAHKATVTTCDTDKPDWKITGKHVDITLEGYGSVKHAAFWIKNVPVMYSPFFMFPVKMERQSGLLVPEFGSSDRRGIEYEQPFYWAISESSDATVYAHYMSERGVKAAGEYRYVLSPRSKGALMIDYLDDRKVDDGEGSNSKDWGYEGDDELRPNNDRYWFRMKGDQELPFGFDGRLDIDIVSDQDYMYEFKQGYTGFDRTKDYFLQQFGREIDDYTDPIRTNRLALNRIWPHYSLNAEMLWYDNVVNRRWKETDDTLQRLPYISFNSSKQAIASTPVNWSIESQYTNFYRQDGAKGQRVDLFPQVYWPRRFNNYLYMEPYVGFRETVWYMNTLEEESENDDRFLSREMFNAGIDFSTQLSRVYGLSPKDEGFLSRHDMWPEKIKHSVQPRFSYEYIPEASQGDLPFFDALDRIRERNRFTLSLVNTLTSRTKTPDSAGRSQKERPEKGPGDDYSYNQFLWFEIQQSYEVNSYDDEDDIFSEAQVYDRTDPEEGKHFSPLYGRLEVQPSTFYSIRADAEWSHLDGNFFSRNIGMSLWDLRGDTASAEYRFTRDYSESLYANLRVKLSHRLSSFAEYERNIEDGENIKTGFGLTYNSQCWSVDMNYTNERDDYSYGVVVNLFGLGGVGSN